MRRAQMRDRNEGPIRKRAEALGFLWLENNASTKGRPDATLLRTGATYWCEVKYPGEPFTKDQIEQFSEMAAYGVPVFVIEVHDDVDRLAAGLLKPWAPSDVTATYSRGRGSRAKTPRKHRPGHSRARTLREMCVVSGCARSALSGSVWCALHEPITD